MSTQVVRRRGRPRHRRAGPAPPRALGDVSRDALRTRRRVPGRLRERAPGARHPRPQPARHRRPDPLPRAAQLGGDPHRADPDAHRACRARPTACIGLELGADDYLTKPFSLRELAARGSGRCVRRVQWERGVPGGVYRDARLRWTPHVFSVDLRRQRGAPDPAGVRRAVAPHLAAAGASLPASRSSTRCGVWPRASTPARSTPTSGRSAASSATRSSRRTSARGIAFGARHEDAQLPRPGRWPRHARGGAGWPGRAGGDPPPADPRRRSRTRLRLAVGGRSPQTRPALFAQPSEQADAEIRRWAAASGLRVTLIARRRPRPRRLLDAAGPARPPREPPAPTGGRSPRRPAMRGRSPAAVGHHRPPHDLRGARRRAARAPGRASSAWHRKTRPRAGHGAASWWRRWPRRSLAGCAERLGRGATTSAAARHLAAWTRAAA